MLISSDLTDTLIQPIIPILLIFSDLTDLTETRRALQQSVKNSAALVIWLGIESR